MYGGRGDVGEAVGAAARVGVFGGVVRVCAPPGPSEGGQPVTTTRLARGTTRGEAAVIRSAGAAQWDTTDSEVSR